MAASAVHWIEAFQHVLEHGDGKAFLPWIAMDPPTYTQLQSSLQSMTTTKVGAKLRVPTNLTSQKKRLTSFAQDFLDYVHLYPPPSSPQIPREAYDAWVKVYASANAVFALPETVWMVPIFKYLAQQLVAMAIRLDQADASAAYTKTIDAASRLSKSAGLAANDRTTQPCRRTKRAAVFTLANVSFRAYFRLNNTRLCETVLGSVNNALLMNRRHDDTDATGEESYTMAERVTYHYYLGQIRLLQHRVLAAVEHLRWAFDRCTNAHPHNKRKILIPLVAAHLILGRYASRSLLTQFQLTEPYGELLRRHRMGHAAGALATLEQHREWFRTCGLYMLLREKMVLGLWRNLFQRCMRSTQSATSATQGPPTLSLQTLVRPARMAWDDPSLDLADMECMAANLVDQGLMKAYILHSKGVIVLQRGPHRGFPPMTDVYHS
ncbi:transcription export complex 2 protein [Malassezia pachydermatis]